MVHPPAPENKQFYPALNGLRAVAVLMVFFEHYLRHPAALLWGWTGVDFFFVLSGFLITGILYDTQHTEHRFKIFYARRALRIFPLYYGVLLIALLVTPIFRWQWHPVQLLWPFYLGNLGRFFWLHDYQTIPKVLDHLVSTRWNVSPPLIVYLGHFWSLCVEEQFYLFWPMVVFGLRTRAKLGVICIAALPICLLARILCVLYLPQGLLNADFLERFTPLRLDSLLLGGALALALRGSAWRWVATVAPKVMWSIAAAAILMEVYYRVMLHRFYDIHISGGWLPTIGYTLIDLFAAAVIVQAIDPSTRIYSMLTLKPLMSLGEISYGFYVFHDIPHVFYEKSLHRVLAGKLHTLEPYLLLCIAFCGTLVLSSLSFRFYEMPFLKLKRLFIPQRVETRSARLES